jgi:hypothetical protein
VMVDGQEWRQCLANQPKTYLSASGPITVSRHLYRPAGGGKSICPLELRAGIIGGLHTPVLARQVAFLMGHMTSDETSQVFTELGIEGPSSSTCDLNVVRTSSQRLCQPPPMRLTRHQTSARACRNSSL